MKIEPTQENRKSVLATFFRYNNINLIEHLTSIANNSASYTLSPLLILFIEKIPMDEIKKMDCNVLNVAFRLGNERVARHFLPFIQVHDFDGVITTAQLNFSFVKELFMMDMPCLLSKKEEKEVLKYQNDIFDSVSQSLDRFLPLDVSNEIISYIRIKPNVIEV